MSHTFADVLAAPDTIAARELEDGSVITLRRLMFGSIQLAITRAEDLPMGIISDQWQYNPGYFTKLHFASDEDKWTHTFDQALAAYEAWDGKDEPTGWTRHNGTGRRRYDGDPATEKVRA